MSGEPEGSHNRDVKSVSALQRAGDAYHRLARCFALDPRLCIQLATWRVSLPLLKFLIPLPSLARLMWATPSALSLTAEGARAGEMRVLEIVRTGGRLLVSGNCLERSLVLYRYLSSSGSDPRLVVGVTRDDAGIAGHTWVELDGQPVDDTQSTMFEPVVAFGRNGLRTVEIKN